MNPIQLIPSDLHDPRVLEIVDEAVAVRDKPFFSRRSDPRTVALVEKAVNANRIEPTVTRVRTCYDPQPAALDWIVKGLFVASSLLLLAIGFIAGRAGVLDWMVGQ